MEIFSIASLVFKNFTNLSTAGCIESLKNLLMDDDNTVRCKATEVLSILATHDIGRNALLDFGVIVPLSLVSILCGTFNILF